MRSHDNGDERPEVATLSFENGGGAPLYGGGALQPSGTVGADGGTLAGSGFNPNNHAVWNGAVNGPGTLHVVGPLTLAGTNTLPAGIVVDRGTLQLSKQDGSIGIGSIDMDYRGILVFDGNDNFGHHNKTAGPNIVMNGGTITNTGAYINAIQNLTLSGDAHLQAAGEYGQWGS